MKDCRGKVIASGDMVALATFKGQIVLGRVVNNPESDRRVALVINNKIRKYKKFSSRMLNLTAYC